MNSSMRLIDQTPQMISSSKRHGQVSSQAGRLVGKDCRVVLLGCFTTSMGKGWVECVVLGIDALLMAVVYVGCYA